MMEIGDRYYQELSSRERRGEYTFCWVRCPQTGLLRTAYRSGRGPWRLWGQADPTAGLPRLGRIQGPAKNQGLVS